MYSESHLVTAFSGVSSSTLQEEQKTMKSKMREKVRPKMGKIDIDYQKLHDAFFKWQTKPKLTIHGDLYYEVREGPGRPCWALGRGCVTRGWQGFQSWHSSQSPQPQSVH